MDNKILLIDYEPDMGDLFAQKFRKEIRNGTFCIKFISDSLKALDYFSQENQHAPSAILSDIKMPGADGFEILKQAKDRWPDTPVFLISAFSDEEMKALVASRGADAFVPKPIDFGSLGSLLQANFHPRKPQ
jgi:DNA-binding response OmpR family regulator